MEAMRADAAAIERETLLSFLASVPPGGHVAVCLDGITVGEALRLCEEASRDAGERLLVADRGFGFAGMRRHDLADLASAARGAGARGILLAVDGDDALASSHEGHVIAEQALGPEPMAGARVFCFYTRASRDAWPRVLPAHAERLDERAWQVA